MGSRGRRVEEEEEEEERSSTRRHHRVGGFYRIITPTILREGKMEIIDKMGGDEIGERAAISVPSGDVWMVGVEWIGKERMMFTENMKEMMEFYGVEAYYMLIFRYKGESNFSVVICDTSTAEIPYPRRLLL